MPNGKKHSGVTIIGRSSRLSSRSASVFHDVRLPNGANAKVMNRDVFRTASGAANRKLEQVITRTTDPSK